MWNNAAVNVPPFRNKHGEVGDCSGALRGVFHVEQRGSERPPFRNKQAKRAAGLEHSGLFHVEQRGGGPAAPRDKHAKPTIAREHCGGRSLWNSCISQRAVRAEGSS